VTATLLLSLALALPAADSPEQIFKSAIEDFEFGEHAAAATKLRSILEPIRLANPEDVIVARQYLGACEHLLDDLDAAKKEFSLLLALDPEHRLDPEVFSPAVVQFFENVRADAGLAMKRKEAAPPPPVVPPPPPPKMQTEVVSGRYPAALGLIPLGVGQFFNYHPVRGSIFAILEVGLLATCGATFGLYGSKRSAALRDGHAMETSDGLIFNPGFEEDASDIRRLQTVAYVTLWTGLAVVVAGVIEALISYPGDAVIVEKQPAL
jgi:hypothetical protein